MRALPVLWVVLAVLLPPASATHTNGSEQEPHVEDEKGNVRDHPAYQGARGQHYMDLTAAWLEYLPHNDTVQVNLKFVSFEDFHSQSGGWSVDYHLTAHARPAGSEPCLVWLLDCTALVVGADKLPDSKEFVWSAYWVGPNDRNVELPASGRIEYTTPGYVRLWVPAGEVAGFGTRFEGIQAGSYAHYHVQGIPTTIDTANEALSDAVFELEPLEALQPPASAAPPQSAPSADEDGPGGDVAPSMGPAVPEGPDRQQAPAASMLAAVAMLGLGLLLRRR